MKVFLSVLAIGIVIGSFYLLTLFSPGRVTSTSFGHSDIELEGDQLIKQSEELEREFDIAAAANTYSETTLEKLRRAIRFQELYIDKAKTMSRAPAERLSKLQKRLQDIESEPFAKIIADLEKNAEKALEAEEIKKAENLYKQAYDIQSRINSDFPLSKYNDVRKRVRFDREVKMLQAKPSYLLSVKYEKEASAAFETGDFQKAEELYAKTVETILDMNAKYPMSIYTDFTRLQKLDIIISSIKSGGLRKKVEDNLAIAKNAESKGEFLLASEAYGDAAESQKNLNKLYPKSTFVSEEKRIEYERKKDETYSRKYAYEILEQDKMMTNALRAGDFSQVPEMSANLLRKTEHFRENFPKSTIINNDIMMRMRYINFMVRDIPKIHSEILGNIVKFDANNDREMLKTEVTQELYSMVMQENPSRYPNNPKHPVDSVTLEDAVRFCNRASWLLGMKVSIPMEDDYKKAIGSLRYVDINDVSWNLMNSKGLTQVVATKKPNDKGIYDLLGNVSEFVWVSEGKLPDTAMTIGGNAQSTTESISEFAISSMDPKQRNRMVGFRILVFKNKKDEK